MFPEHTPEYKKARNELYKPFDVAIKPHWERYLAGEITHTEYQTLIKPFWKTYSDKLESHWVKAGGEPNKKGN